MKPSSRRQLLLNTAYSLFNQYGFHPTGINLIIKESGTSKATLYKFFKTKETLILEVLKMQHEIMITNIHTEIRNNHANDNPILVIFDVYTDWFKATPFYGCFFHKASSEFSSKDSSINQFAMQSKQELFELIVKYLHHQNHKLCTVKEKARSIMILLDGAITNAQTFNNTDSAMTAKRIAKRILQDV